MRLAHAYLVVVDISGYTAFINERDTSLLHAEQIITELMETVIDRCTHPLLVNKLEGDAALLYAEAAPGDQSAARDVLAQVKAFFPAFDHCLGQQRKERSNCPCDACTGIDRLRLKAFVHVGEFAIKQVRHFQELAGEAVILVHRLMKNQVPRREYVLLTEAARAAAGMAPATLESHREQLEGIGDTQLWLLAPDAIPFELPADSTAGDAPAARSSPSAPGFGQRLRAWFARD